MRGDTPRAQPRPGIAFLAGSLTVVCILALPLAFLAFRIGISAVTVKLRRAFELATGTQKLVVMPEDIRRELRALNAVVEFAGEAGGTHDTILTRPDPELGWALRPNARIVSYVLRAANPINLNPPVVHLETHARPSDALRHYLEEQTRLEYRYAIDAEGFRVTLPVVESDRRLFMVGDSVLFGVGVNDDATMASQLQGMVGPAFRIVNAGVGGYNGPQIVAAVDALTRKGAYDALIYVACQNDFMVESAGPYDSQARRTLEGLAAFKERFPGGMILMLQTTMEYSLYDVLLDGGGWPRHMIDGTEVLRRALPPMARRFGFRYSDWTDISADHTRQHGSLLARFALYTDHVHLSPEGNRLAAAKLHELLREARKEP